MRRLSNIILLALVTIACKSTKKTTAVAPSPPPTPVVAVVPADTVKKELKREPYRASNKRQNDILHTKLEVSFDWTNSRMNGRAEIDVKPYFYPVNMLYLDARGMDIKKLEVTDLGTIAADRPERLNKNAKADAVTASVVATASYVYENDSIKINLGKTFNAWQKYRVSIEYVAKPGELKSGGSAAISDDKGLYFINPKGENTFKMPQIWTQGETQANSAWMPTIDSPNEKMTQEILMKVEDRFTTLSNGILVSSVKNQDGTRTDHWKLDQPHSPYLAMMAVGEFKKVTDAPWNGKEISYYVEKQYEPHAVGIFGDTREMIDFFSKRLGVDYAWPKYAQIAVRDYVSGAMENTSATLHGDFVVYQTTRELIDGKKGNLVIAHELFHQWFGDLATCESWSNLPLNESFATYGEYLWEEYKSGRDAADYHYWQSRQGYMGSSKEANLIRFSYNNREDMFDAISYNKGGQVLHMLRKAVGDDAFFASLKNYLETNRYKSAEIHNLRLAFEETTGRDMNWFFDQWFLNKGRPKLKVTKVYNTGANNVELTIEQNQDLEKAPLYTLPVEVDVYSGGAMERFSLLINEQKQTFTLSCKGEPKLVNFDAERQLLCDLDYKKTTEEYIFQYRNAPLFGDRHEALTELESKMQEAQVVELFKYAAQKDVFYGIRNYAIPRLEKAPEDKQPEIKATLLAIYAGDKKTTTRAKALNALNVKFAADPDVIALNEAALKEQSYTICGEALEAIARRDPGLAMEKAKLFEKESGKQVIFPIANLYANHGADEQLPFFHNAIYYINGFEVLSFSTSYAKTARRCLKSESAISAAMDLETLSKGANKFIKYGLIKGLKDLASAWEVKENGLKTRIEAARKENKDVADLEREMKTATETKEVLTRMYNRSK